MDRRRVLLVVAAVGAGAVLVVLGRPGAQEGALDQPGAPAGAPASAPAAPAPSPAPHSGPTATATATATAAPAGRAPGGATDPPPAEDGPATRTETLAAADLPDVLRTAERFAARWSAPGPDWHDRVAALATPALAAELAGADPPRPAPEPTGPGQVYLGATEWARVGVPAEGGTIVLDVVATGGPAGDWLVSAVDWWPA